MIRFFISTVTAALTALMLVSCVHSSYSPIELDAMPAQERALIMVQQPQVNDIYSANLSRFSELFGDGDAFGLMRVVELMDDYLIVVTEDAAWPNQPLASVEELKGDFSDITWDTEEQIVIPLGELESYVNDGSIVATRRLTVEEADAFLKK